MIIAPSEPIYQTEKDAYHRVYTTQKEQIVEWLNKHNQNLEKKKVELLSRVPAKKDKVARMEYARSLQSVGKRCEDQCKYSKLLITYLL